MEDEQHKSILSSVSRREERDSTIDQRQITVNDRNAQIERLVTRLEICDDIIASLLSQSADSLDLLVNAHSYNVTAPEQDVLGSHFDERVQEWFSSLHEVQMGMRSAVKNLRKRRAAPIAYNASSIASGSASTITTGSASRGHSLKAVQPSSPARVSQVSVDIADLSEQESSHSRANLLRPTWTNDTEERKLSLSTLRLQEAAWKQLAASLENLAASKNVLAEGPALSARFGGEAQSPTSAAASSSKIRPRKADLQPLSRMAETGKEAEQEQARKQGQYHQESLLLSALLCLETPSPQTDLT